MLHKYKIKIWKLFHLKADLKDAVYQEIDGIYIRFLDGKFLSLQSVRENIAMKESVRILRFALVGTANAIITALVIWICMELMHYNYLWSNIAGYVAALINNFFWSKYWVFSSKAGSFWREVPLFLLAFGCAYLAQFLFLLLLVEVMHLNEYLGQFLGLFVYGAVNFILNRKVTFQNK